MMPKLHGGHGLIKNDAIVFHNAAVELVASIHANGWSEWSLFPTGNFGNVGVLAALYTRFGPEPAVFIPLEVAIAGGTGSTGKSLVKRFLATSFTTHALSRKKRRSTKRLIWLHGDVCGKIPKKFFVKNKPFIHIAGSNNKTFMI